ncbi:hypothetical protein Tco_0485039, partial [Tanacetum coccineum]
KHAAECADECAALANLIANLTLDTEEKTILKQLKKANASLTQELKECRTNLDETGRYGYIKNHKKIVKNGQARTRESEEYKKKPKNQSRSQKSQTRSQIQHVSYGESTQVMGFCANLLTKEAQHVTSKNDTLAILRYTQFDQTAQIHLAMIRRIKGAD